MENEYVKFDPKELEIKDYINKDSPYLPPIPVYNSPITPRENFRRMLSHEHYLWLPHTLDVNYLFPWCVPDSIARGMVSNSTRFTPDQFGGKDMFGIEWEYVPQVQGSMVRPGVPFLDDLDNWRDVMKEPDIDSWPWEECAKEAAASLADGRFVKISFFTGFFERVISMIEMTDALMAMIDEDFYDTLHELFDWLANIYDKIFAKYEEYFHPDCVWFHDDWGNQLAPFFHGENLQEVIGPHMKKVVESAHKHGMFFELHSCGKIESLVPVMIECGIDMWNGQIMNDKVACAKQYGDKIVVDSYTPDIPHDADEATVRKVLGEWLDQFGTARHYVGLNFGSHPLEYKVLYELSRKLYNP